MSLSIETFDYLDAAYLFDQVAHRSWSIFLDSGVINKKQTVSKHADYDVIAIDPITTLVTENEFTNIACKISGKLIKDQQDPLKILQRETELFDFVQNSTRDMPLYLPGAIGYFSYDLSRRYDALLDLAVNDELLPEMAMGIYTCIVLIDHRNKQTSLIWWGDHSFTQKVVNEWKKLITFSLNYQSMNNQSTSNQKREFNSAHNDYYKERLIAQELQENLNQHDYKECFDQVRNYHIDGDCYQVNLAKRFSAEVTGDGWLTYQYLREISPAPYGSYMNLPFAQVLSNSPESFIQCRDRRVVTNPIKGTRARHENKQRDVEITEELVSSEKDRAENLMIVDLMRNDLSKCCELNSVSVPKLFSLHSFANVHHLISTVEGTLKQELHSLDLLKQCFPGGSITGAPKIQAMQIIEELEPHRRGLYCGAIGYIGIDGNMETNIAIRTIVVKDGIARYFAGGGLVIDSELDAEYQEVTDKAKMMTKALFD